MILVKLKPLEWFKENAFKDHDGDFWKTLQARRQFDNYHQDPPNDYAMYSHNIERGFMEYEAHIAKAQSWAIERVLTKENDPEYFLIQ